MLRSLSIRNFILIDDLRIEFEEGMIVLTGETGAGKSIILDALGLILGGRFDGACLSKNPNLSVMIAAHFDLSPSVDSFLKEQGLVCDDDLLIIRRVIDERGKSKSFVNDQPVTLALLKSLGELTLDIHGQFEKFMSPTHYQHFVDNYGVLHDDVKRVRETFNQWSKVKQDFSLLKSQQDNQDQRIDEITFYIEDLKRLQPRPDEEQYLLNERDILKNATKNTDAFRRVLQCFEKGMIDHVIDLQKTLQKCEGYEQLSDRIDPLLMELSDIECEIRDKFSLSTLEPHHLEALDDRLHELRQASRKFRVPCDDLYKLLEQLEDELVTLASLEDRVIELQKMEESLKKEFITAAKVLTQKRKATAEQLSQAVMVELPPLKLEHAHFCVHVSPQDERGWNAKGVDHIQFAFSANPGMPIQDMEKVASGGELSRLMLALKVVGAGKHSSKNSLGKTNDGEEDVLLSKHGTLVFDEIDSGVSGSTSTAIGARLKRLSKKCQVITITHSPQVAAFADQHLKVKKEVRDNAQTVVQVCVQNDYEHFEEIARMLSGEQLTAEAMQAAQSLVRNSNDSI